MTVIHNLQQLQIHPFVNGEAVMKKILANLIPIRRYGCKSIGMNNLGTLSFTLAQQSSPGGATS